MTVKAIMKIAISVKHSMFDQCVIVFPSHAHLHVCLLGGNGWSFHLPAYVPPLWIEIIDGSGFGLKSNWNQIKTKQF